VKDFWDKWGSIAKSITAVMAMVAMLFSGYFYLQGEFTPVLRTVSLERRVSMNEIVGSLRTAIEERNFLRDQNRKYPTDQRVKDELEEVEEEVDDLKVQVKELKKKQVGGE